MIIVNFIINISAELKGRRFQVSEPLNLIITPHLLLEETFFVQWS